MNRVHLAKCAVVFASTIGTAAVAAPCAGFTDVQDTSGFCSNIEWVKNRAITLGCTSATTYCPNDPVGRIQMAAFLNRLGTALTPVELHTSASVEALLDIDAPGPGGAEGPLVCISDAFAIPATGYPRYASVDAIFSARFNASAEACVNLYYTDDAGLTWQWITECDTVVGASVAAIAASAAAIGKRVELQPGKTYRFAVGLERADGPTTGDPTIYGCALRVTISNRNGLVSPHDPQ